MAKFCSTCGTEIKAGETVCGVCLAPVNESVAAQSQPQPQPPIQPQFVPQAQPAPKNNVEMAPVVSPGKFFGLTLLFSLPVIGFIMLIVMSIAPENKTIRNYARSYWFVLAVVIVLAVILGIVIFLLTMILGVSVESMVGSYI